MLIVAPSGAARNPTGGVGSVSEGVCTCFTAVQAFRGGALPFGARALQITSSKRMRKTAFERA
jgi:hypothetical protein